MRALLLRFGLAVLLVGATFVREGAASRMHGFAEPREELEALDVEDR